LDGILNAESGKFQHHGQETLASYLLQSTDVFGSPCMLQKNPIRGMPHAVQIILPW
jgi:hypothetical protein